MSKPWKRVYYVWPLRLRFQSKNAPRDMEPTIGGGLLWNRCGYVGALYFEWWQLPYMTPLLWLNYLARVLDHVFAPWRVKGEWFPQAEYSTASRMLYTLLIYLGEIGTGMITTVDWSDPRNPKEEVRHPIYLE